MGGAGGSWFTSQLLLERTFQWFLLTSGLKEMKGTRGFDIEKFIYLMCMSQL